MKSCLAFLDAGQLFYGLKWSLVWERTTCRKTGAEVLCSRRKEDRKSYSSSLPETLLIT